MKNEFRVGLFFVVALALLFFIFDFIGDIPIFSNDKTVVTYFDSIAELRESNPVKLEGVPIGKVSKIELGDGKIKVFMKVNKNAPIKKDSKASIRLTSLLGTSYVNISFGTNESSIANESDFLPSENPADLNQILVKLDSAIGSVDSALGVFSGFDNNKEAFNNIVTNLDTVLSDLADGKGTLGKLIKDESLYNELNGAFSGINELSDSINSGKGTLGKLLKDDSLYNDTKVAMQSLGKISSSFTESKGTIGKLMNDESLYNEAEEAAKNLNSILKKVNRGEGTLGKLVNDDSLYYDTKNTIQKVDKGVDTVEDLAPLGTLGAVLGVMTVF